MIGIAPFAQLALLLRYKCSAGNLIPLMRLLSMSASSREASGLGFNVEVSVPQPFFFFSPARASWYRESTLLLTRLQQVDLPVTLPHFACTWEVLKLLLKTQARSNQTLQNR